MQKQVLQTDMRTLCCSVKLAASNRDAVLYKLTNPVHSSEARCVASGSETIQLTTDVRHLLCS